MDSKEERRKREARERTRGWLERHPEYAARARQLAIEWKRRNRERVNAARRGYHARHGDIERAAARAYRLRNLERRRAYDRERRLANLQAIRAKDRARSRARYAKDPKAWQTYMKEWRARNPERAHAYVRRSSNRRERAIGLASFTTAEWLALVEAYGGRCAYCGEEGPLEIDHRMPLCRGGSNTIENILPACRHCNRRKHRKTEEEFRAQLERERDQGV